MKKQDSEQDVLISVIKRDIHHITKTMERHEKCFTKAMEKYEKVAKEEREKCETRVGDMINSFNGQADNWKMACDEKFATKDEVKSIIDYVKPIKNAYEKGKDKLAGLGLFVIILLTTIALAMTGILNTIKDKLLK